MKSRWTLSAGKTTMNDENIALDSELGPGLNRVFLPPGNGKQAEDHQVRARGGEKRTHEAPRRRLHGQGRKPPRRAGVRGAVHRHSADLSGCSVLGAASGGDISRSPG